MQRENKLLTDAAPLVAADIPGAFDLAAILAFP